MNPPPSRPLAPRGPSRMPGQVPTPRFASASKPPQYGIQPTPTFSFSDEPVPGPLYKPRGAGGRGGFGLLVVVLAAGVGGYFAVQTPRVWQEVEPLVGRGKALARSLRTLLPGASPEAAPTAVAPSSTTAAPGAATVPPPPSPTPVATPSTSATVAAEAPASRPEVVQIPPEAPPAAKRPQPHHASRAHRPREQAPKSASGRVSKPTSPAFDEAAAEEALLAAP